MTRNEIINLIRSKYDPEPADWPRHRGWDDGAGEIADAILADDPSRFFRASLRSIASKCPATCDMTLAHEMAQEAEEALAASPISSAQGKKEKA